MTKDEMENKSRAFITEIDEILGLRKPIDILKLCATTDLFFKPLEERIAELEKENAELKEQCLILADCNTCHSTCKNENVEMKKQLTKAKGLLKWFVWYFKEGSPNLVPYKHKVKEAEQFIREVEK